MSTSSFYFNSALTQQGGVSARVNLARVSRSVMPRFSSGVTSVAPTSLALSGQRQTPLKEEGLWARPDKDTYAEMESQTHCPFDNVLVRTINEMYVPVVGTTRAPRPDPRGLALDSLILHEVITSSDQMHKVALFQGTTVTVDETFQKLVSGDFNPKDKKIFKKLATYGGRGGLMQYKQLLETAVQEGFRFADENLPTCLDSSVNTFSCRGRATSFGVIALVLKIVCTSDAGRYIGKRMHKYSDERLQERLGDRSYCPELANLCLPMVFELRLALTRIVSTTSQVIADFASRLLIVFNPFENETQENNMKMERYSTIFMSPQLVKHISSSTNSVRPEQQIWLEQMRETYDGFAEHIIAHADDDIVPAFNNIKALAAQMGAGKTTVAAIGTGPIQKHANDLLRKSKVDASIVTAIVEPSLKVSANFAGRMPIGAHTWLIINGRIVPMFDASPVELTGWKRRPERFITDGDFKYSHDGSTKGRNKALRDLSILDQIDWFFVWGKKIGSSKNMKASRAGYAMPTHIFCDPQSAAMLFDYKHELRNRGIFLVGMIDEIVACADCGEATPTENPLAYWYSKLATKVETGWYLSASYSRTNFEHIEVIPSVKDAVSFTQLQLHSGEYVTPLNGIAHLTQEDQMAAIDAWSPRVLRLFPPTLVPAMTQMMANPFIVTTDDLQSSVTYLTMVSRLCRAIIEDENADEICSFTRWRPMIQSSKNTDSALNVYTGNPSVAALELLGRRAITIAKIDATIERYDSEVDQKIDELKRQKAVNAQLAKDREGGSIQVSSSEIQEEIARLIQSKSRRDERYYTFNTPFGSSIIKGDVLEQLIRMPEEDIALALSGIDFDSLAFSPELEKMCQSIETSNSRCEFVGVGNVYGVNDSSIQKVIIRGDPTNLGRESVCQAAGRTARSFDGRNQIGIMSISEPVLQVFADTTSIMEHFADNITSVHSHAATKIQTLFRGYLHRRTMLDVWHLSAMQIESLFRGYKTRKRLSIRPSVIKIQTVARGYIARVLTARIRSRKERRARQRAADVPARRQANQRRAHREEGKGVEDDEGWTHVGHRRGPEQVVVPEPVVVPAPVVEQRGPRRVTGSIDRWFDDRGYGFIRIAGRRDNLYIREQNIRERDYVPSRGDEVSFGIVLTEGRRDEAGYLAPVRYTGTIQNWLDAKDFGFIDVDGGERLFIHLKNVRSYNRRTRTSDYTPRPRDRVEFGQVSNRGRMEASDLVQIV